MENENQIATQMQGANMALMNNPFLLLPNLLLMPLYLFAQLISGMFGTMMPAVTPYQYQFPQSSLQSLPPSSEGETQSPSQQSVPALLQIPRTTYTNTEEWELKRDKSGRLQAIIIHRKATEGGEVIDV